MKFNPNKNQETVEPEAEPVPQIKEDDLKDAIRNIIDTLPERHNARCNRAGCLVCCVDVRSPVERLAAKMGYPRATWPMDLEELMSQSSGLSVDELLNLSPDELAAIFDRATENSLPLAIIGQEKITPVWFFGDQKVDAPVHHLKMSEATRTVKRPRPPTPAEKAQRVLDEAEKARTLAEAKKELARERRIQRAKKELAEALKVVV